MFLHYLVKLEMLFCKNLVCPEERDQMYFVHNRNRSRHILIILGLNYRDTRNTNWQIIKWTFITNPSLPVEWWRSGPSGSRRHCGSHSPVASSLISVRQGRWWTLWTLSLTFVVVLLVIICCRYWPY